MGKVKLFVCGSGSFQRQLQEEDDHHQHDIESPKKPKKGNKNPFADRGLEKFSALLAELEDKKKQIYSQLGSEEIAFIRFDYSNSNRGKPIVVRVKEREKEKEKEKDDEPLEISNQAPVQVQESRPEPGDKKVNGQKKQSRSWDFMKRETWRKPSYYLPAVMILILLLVVLFGRSFAVLCTSVAWYMIPVITGGESNVQRVKKKKDNRRRGSDKGMIVRGGKKDYVRRASDKGMIVDGEAARTSQLRSSPVSVISGAMTEFSPEKHVHHRKSF